MKIKTIELIETTIENMNHGYIDLYDCIPDGVAFLTGVDRMHYNTALQFLAVSEEVPSINEVLLYMDGLFNEAGVFVYE